jgi:hypothetical protein
MGASLTQWAKRGIVGVAIASLCGATLALAPAQAEKKPKLRLKKNEFNKCVTQLQAAGLAPETLGIACSEVLHPQDLASCVSRIGSFTDIGALDALNTCRRVRRPVDLATCVVDIQTFATGATNAIVLDHCRRSLLPVQFSKCVVALNRTGGIEPGGALATCIDGRNHPQDFVPTAAPLEAPPTPETSESEVPATETPATPVPAPAPDSST